MANQKTNKTTAGNDLPVKALARHLSPLIGLNILKGGKKKYQINYRIITAIRN
jgi:hypothetical protein